MSYRTPIKNSSPLSNYSFATPSSESSSSQNDTFIQKIRSHKTSSRNNDLIQLAALNNISTPKKQTQDAEPVVSKTSERGFFSTPMKLKPMVESPFKAKNASSLNNQQHQTTTLRTQGQQQQQEPQSIATSSGVSVSLRNLFNQEPGRFRSVESSANENATHLLNGRATSFEPMLDNNVIIAMARLQNKELSMKKFVTSLFGLLIVKLINSLVRFTYYNTSFLDWIHDNLYNTNVVKFTNYFFIALITVNLITSLLRLLQKQDQCLDLNLSNEQRKLLGLKLIVDEDEDEEDFGKTQTPVKQVIRDQKEMDTIGKTNELLSQLNLSTPRN